MSKKLAAKNALIAMPAPKLATTPEVASPSSPPRPRTAVGGMAQFVTTQSPLHREVEELRNVVAQYDGAQIVKMLVASDVVPSAWANRHEASFDTIEFAELKREILEAGGNVQPIKVRPVLPSARGGQPRAQYEIIFGHRRHRACLELDLPVSAIVEAVGDQQLFEQMERENRGRKNLSAWEQGSMYLAALEQGLYASQRKLAEAIGVDVALISKSIALAKLPNEVIAAFPSPLEVQFRWAQPLGEAVRRDPDGVLCKARDIAAHKAASPLSAAQVLARLTTDPVANVSAAAGGQLRAGAKRVGEWKVDPSGGVKISLAPGVMTTPMLEEFIGTLQAFFEKQ